MSKAISLAILAGGILLLIFGIIEYNSTGSEISQFFTGSTTDKTMWLLMGGVILTVLGAGGILFMSKKSLST
ncbi:MAG TPA: DUF3185 family protein [Bacteroidales bacterium]|nr:DUF3185 family protein [Bacteroidales bacterium]